MARFATPKALAVDTPSDPTDFPMRPAVALIPSLALNSASRVNLAMALGRSSLRGGALLVLARCSLQFGAESVVEEDDLVQPKRSRIRQSGIVPAHLPKHLDVYVSCRVRAGAVLVVGAVAHDWVDDYCSKKKLPILITARKSHTESLESSPAADRVISVTAATVFETCFVGAWLSIAMNVAPVGI